MNDLAISARVGANVRRFRTLRGLSIRRMGELLHDAGLDLSKSGLSRLEHGERPVTVDELVTLADVLDAAPSDLIEQETIITGGGDLRMTLAAVQDDEVDDAEPPSLVDPKVLDAMTSLAIGAELRAIMQLLATTTVTPSTLETIRTITRTVSEDMGRTLGAKAAALAQATAPRHTVTREPAKSSP